MHRCSSGFLLLSALAALLGLSACIGKSTKNDQGGTVQTVTLSPSSSVSLELGDSQTFTAIARDANGRTVLSTITFSVSCTDQQPCAPISVANNGRACAGSWDSLSSPVVCTPGIAGFAQITATVQGVSSAPTKIYAHQHIQSIQLSPLSPPDQDCFSQGQTWDFQGHAFSSNNVDITDTVGPLNWSSSTANVVTIDSNKDLPNNQVQVTAKEPGVTNLFAAVSGTSSAPMPFTTCLVKSVKLSILGGSGNSVNLAAGSTKTIEATVVDTRDVVLSKPALTWSTSNPEIATVSTTGVVTAKQTPGAAAITASCTPPTCNIGLLPAMPVYATGGHIPGGQPAFAVITVHTTNSKRPTAIAWAGTTDCDNLFNCVSVMFPVAAGNTPIGSAVAVPHTPNSMLFNPAGTRVYMGSDEGLMFLDVGAQTLAVSTVSSQTTPCNVAVCGKPLTISSDGNLVVVADTKTDPNQVYIFDAAHPTAAPVDLLIPGATSASFSPDQLKLFILTDTGKMYIYSTVESLQSVSVSPSANGIAFSADASFAYVSATPGNNVSAYSTCTIPPNASANLGNIGTSSKPLKIFPLPDVSETVLDDDHSEVTQNILALEQGTITGSASKVQILTAKFTRDPIELINQFTCNLPELTFSSSTPITFGQGDFVPIYSQVTGDGSHVVVVAQNIPSVLVMDVNGSTTTAYPLVGGGVPVAASTSQDGTQIFVAACESFVTDDHGFQRCASGAAIHIVDVAQGGDIVQAVYTNTGTHDSMCTNLDVDHPCTPNLIAVKPQ